MVNNKEKNIIMLTLLTTALTNLLLEKKIINEKDLSRSIEKEESNLLGEKTDAQRPSYIG